MDEEARRLHKARLQSRKTISDEPLHPRHYKVGPPEEQTKAWNKLKQTYQGQPTRTRHEEMEASYFNITKIVEDAVKDRDRMAIIRDKQRRKLEIKEKMLK